LTNGILIGFSLWVESLVIESDFKLLRSDEIGIRLHSLSFSFERAPQAIRHMLYVFKHLVHPLQRVPNLIHDLNFCLIGLEPKDLYKLGKHWTV
jgi:hypothetical protein